MENKPELYYGIYYGIICCGTFIGSAAAISLGFNILCGRESLTFEGHARITKNKGVIVDHNNLVEQNRIAEARNITPPQ